MEGNIPQINFLIEKRIFTTSTEDDQLVFVNEDPSPKAKTHSQRRVIKFSDVLQVHVLQQIMSGKKEKSSSATSASSSTSSDQPPQSAIIIDYVRKATIVAPKHIASLIPNSNGNFLWEPAKVVLKCPSDFYPLCLKIAEKINAYIAEKETQRPKSLLVIINPMSGQKKGQSIYDRQIQPIFKLAGLKAEVIISKSETHANEVLDTYDLQSIDGIVSVGGDGTYTQVINALVRRTAKDRELNLDDIHHDLDQLPMKIGIIPSGTGQGCIRMLTGRFDPVSAAMHIILGTETAVNLFSVHSGGKLVSYGSMLACFGFLGEAIKESESRRKLGRFRYPISLLNSLIKYNKHDVVVEVQQSSSSDSWETITGSYVSVNTWLWDVQGINLENREPIELFINMNKSWNEGSLLVQLISSSSGRIGFMRQMKDMMSMEEVTDASTVRFIACEALRLKTQPSSARSAVAENVINIDGDPFTLESSFEIRLKRKALRMFGNILDEDLLRSCCSKKTK